MACTSPLYRLPAIIPEQVPEPFRKRIRNKGVVMSREDRDYLIQVHHVPEDNIQQIPCGQCKDCRLEYSRQWAVRCMLESSYHKHNYFVTCTYSDEFLPNDVLFDNITGEILQNEKGFIHNLEPDDATKFIKRLRITFERKGLKSEELMYYYCGEYGEKTQRPHFHFLFFNLNLPDLTISHVRNGNVFYHSDLLSKIWGKGIVVVGEVCFDTCAYVSRYVMKKVKGEGAKEIKNRFSTVFLGDTPITGDELSKKLLAKAKEKKDKGFQPEFCRMSRRPAIAKRYFDEHKGEIYKTDEMFVKTNKGLMTVKPSRYYDKLYDVENPEQLSEVKFNRRKVGKANKISREERTSLNEVEYNKQRANKKNLQVLKLRRDVE